jgi:hypothetical protein
MRFAFWLLLSLFLARGDYGAGIDPNGGRVVGRLGDEGNGLDPHGGRVTGQGDEGVGIDPFGRVSAQYTGCVDPNGG